MPIEFRPYQIPIFQDNTTGVLCLHWARQIGKSYVLAAWAIWRLLTKPGRLVTVLSNSKDNGIKFAQKCQAICNDNGAVFEQFTSVELETLVTEIRIKVQGRTGRIKILASNPRTARGFSGDLILDEFAFHQDDTAILEAAEPILNSNKDFLCRIASAGTRGDWGAAIGVNYSASINSIRCRKVQVNYAALSRIGPLLPRYEFLARP